MADGRTDPTPVVVTVNVPRGVARMARTSAWQLRYGDGHLFGTFARTRGDGQKIWTGSDAFKRIALVVSKGVGYGSVRVFLNGHAVSPVISLRAATTRARVLVPVRTFSTTQHGRVAVRVVSSGKVVHLEGIGVAAR